MDSTTEPTKPIAINSTSRATYLSAIYSQPYEAEILRATARGDVNLRLLDHWRSDAQGGAMTLCLTMGWATIFTPALSAKARGVVDNMAVSVR